MNFPSWVGFKPRVDDHLSECQVILNHGIFFFLIWVECWTRSNCKSLWFHDGRSPFMMGTNSATGFLHFGSEEESKPLLKVLLGTQEGEFTQLPRHYPLILAGWCGKWTQKYICVSNGSSCSPQVKKKKNPKLWNCKIESFQWSKKIVLWSQGECLSKAYIKLKRSRTVEKGNRLWQCPRSHSWKELVYPLQY